MFGTFTYMSNKHDYARLDIRMPQQLKAQLKIYVKRNGVEMSDVVRAAIASYLAERGVVVETVQLGKRFGRNPATADAETN